MTIRVGIGGWKFAPWRGTFYPPTLARRNEPQYAASRLTAIEINATFYGRHKPQSYRDWAAAAPDGFRFEPRHESFRDKRFFDLAKQRNMAVVMADSEEYPCFDRKTADFPHARLQRSTDATAREYGDAALDGWAEKAREWSTGGRDVFVFFIGGAKVRNPAAGQALIERVAG